MAVAELTRAPEVLARKNGRCKVCPEPIVAGESYIAKTEKHGWTHAGCAADLRRAKEIFDEHEEHDTDGATGASKESS